MKLPRDPQACEYAIIALMTKHLSAALNGSGKDRQYGRKNFAWLVQKYPELSAEHGFTLSKLYEDAA
jgi:hypothetical protein